MFRRKVKEWHTPGGQFYIFYQDMLSQPHVFVGGMQGESRDAVRDGFFHTALFKSPNEIQFILIDMLRVALDPYRDLPHTVAYTDRTAEGVRLLSDALNLIQNRLDKLRKKGKSEIIFPDVYVIVEEYRVMTTDYGREIERLLRQILLMGRVAKVHLILFSAIYQEYNGLDEAFPAHVLLCGASSNKVKRITGLKDISIMPGEAVYKWGGTPVYVKLPVYNAEELERQVSWWKNQ